MSDNIKRIADNRAARHEYFILERYEAGIELFGTEVKSIRAGSVNLKDAWIGIEKTNGAKSLEAFVNQMHISPYEQGNIFNREPLRKRRLLLHKREILKLYSEIKKGGLTLIPLQLYFKNSRVKIAVGLCKGKQSHDKRQAIADRDSKRMLDREMKRKI